MTPGSLKGLTVLDMSHALSGPFSTMLLAELGADCIKTFHTQRFPEVVEGCPVPIFGLGAEKTPTQLDALRLARREIDDGARGVVFGRNAIQVPDPPAFQRALIDVVKQGMSPEEALEKHALKD